MAPAPWQSVPGYGSQPVPKPVMRVCVQTPFPDLCARALSFRVDPKSARDTRRLAELSTRVAIDAGTALAAFGCARFAGEAMVLMQRRARQFEKLVIVAAAIAALL
ncbi:hypothetical protein E2562_013983 [Oryza meyeriana var. granulata]|uniref:Pectinesterase inhibitor domain-containing protein n=1 Tax=Oryza meyeriana var. granulata TaxID=110450 RepID=A0A6G1DKP8_9ORYZ|nr:hypothetical protein E2562_013983 [Oryza meyeriana var. granulata]